MPSQPITNETTSLLHDHASTPSIPDAASCRRPTRTDYALVSKVAAAMYSFATLGLFNSSIGAILPLLSSYYTLTDLQVSVVFLVGPLGYIVAAQCSSAIHQRFGQLGIAFLGPVLQIISAGLLCSCLPFGVVLLGFAVQGLGTGLLDGSWCAWAGQMDKANTISGLLHGSYSVGAAVGPLLVTYLTERNWAWYEWYYMLVVLSALDLVVLCTAFQNEGASKYRLNHHSDREENTVHLRTILQYSATWLSAAYFLTDVGVETAISGWVVSFMTRSRNATLFLAGVSSSGFWAGMALGRLALGPVTDRLGVRSAVYVYSIAAIVFEVAFVFLSNPVVSVGLMVALGVVMGPLFPSGVVVLTQLLPRPLHVAAVSFVASIGQVGGALLPFGIGAVVDSFGIGVFRYAILLQTILALLAWFAFARLPPAELAVSPEAQTIDERNE